MKILYPLDVKINYHSDKTLMKSNDVAIGIIDKKFNGYDALLPYGAIKD